MFGGISAVLDYVLRGMSAAPEYRVAISSVPEYVFRYTSSHRICFDVYHQL